MATKANTAKREAGKISAKKDNANTSGMVFVDAAAIWNGDLPKRGSGYMRDKAALTAIAYPLIDMVIVGKQDGRITVSFPSKIVLPKTFTKTEVVNAVHALASY